MMAKKKQTIPDMRHPEYLAQLKDWDKWRRVYSGGDEFVQHYLTKFSTRERATDFKNRKAITPIPTFAKAAVNDVKNSIFQRMTDITRQGGSEAYQSAVKGLENGVDLRGSTMSAFVGQDILPELLVMGKVGCYVDMPALPEAPSLLDAKTVRPYLYLYAVEDILSWSSCGVNEPDHFRSLLLRDRCIDYDPMTQLAFGEVERYRHLWIDPITGKVNVQFYTDEALPVDQDGNPSGPIELAIDTIPFVMFDIKQSLIEDVSNHQIALLNLGSSDVAYALKANFPFYIEQHDLRAGSSHLIENNNPDAGAVAGNQQGRDEEITVGAVQGRKYDLNAEAPSFIHPSPEPLEASMKLQEKLKEDIRLLVNLAVTNINPKMASAESKQLDQAGLESGLSYIGLVLENGERRIARFWSMYENEDTATVKYPEKYSLKSDADRRQEAKDHNELKFAVPSKTFHQQINKDVIGILLGGKISLEDREKMEREVEAAGFQTSDPEIIEKDFKNGLVSTATASEARGYDPAEVEEAKKDHADRLALIQAAQTPPGGAPAGGARGVPDKAASPDESRAEKAGKDVRGAGTKLDKEDDDDAE
jgi:hypothetical protein